VRCKIVKERGISGAATGKKEQEVGKHNEKEESTKKRPKPSSGKRCSNKGGSERKDEGKRVMDYALERGNTL